MNRSDLVAWLLTYSLHSTVLLGAVWFLTARRIVRSHQLQDTFWKAALVGGLITATAQYGFGIRPAGSVAIAATAAIPAAVPLDLRTPAGALESGAAPIAVTRHETTGNSSAAASTHSPSPGARSEPTGGPVAGSAPPARPLPLATLALGAWLTLALLALLQFITARVRLGRRLGRREPVIGSSLRPLLESLCQVAGVRRPIRLTSAAGLASPVALGRSEICIPHAVLTDLDHDQQRSVLAHELAHLTRHDPIWLTAACLIERVFCFQPLNRLARRRMQETAEYICDDWAVRRTGSSLTMAKSLVKVAEWMHGGPQPVPLSGMAENSSQLLQRVRRLVENREPAQPIRRWRIPAALALIGITAAAMPGVTSLAQQPSRETAQQPADTSRRRARPPRPPRGIAASEMPVPDVSLSPPPVPMPTPAPEEPFAPRIAGFDRQAIRQAVRASIRPVLAGLEGHAVRDTGSVTRQVEALIAALKDSDIEVRRVAAHSLGELEDKRAVPGLVAAMRDSDAEVRKMSAWSLGQLEDRSAALALAAALRDSDANVRATSAWALGQLDLKTAPQALLDAMSDRDPEVRKSALNALSQMEDPRAVPALRALLGDSDATSRRLAIHALAEIRDSSAMQAIIGAMQSRDADVRRAAAAALGER